MTTAVESSVLLDVLAGTPEAAQLRGIREGLWLVNAMHISATVFINADAHLKRTIMGRDVTVAVTVAVTAGKLDFGPWEQIFYGEFDGRRRKRVLIKIIGE